ncbi:MAG: 50S ribosomal protein L18 [bacterium]|nr:50S ribosomal protein L18 [bacterium]
MERKKIIDNARIKRHKRLRQKIVGSAVRPRLCVFRSLKHIYAQLIDDENGRTLVGVSTLSPEIKSTVNYGGNIKAAQEVGKLIAKKALEQDITQVVFDRGGYQYHGRVAALAKEVRESGIKF